MADTAKIQTAIGSLTVVYPQFVSNTLAGLTDEILTAVQNFTDPFSALADLQLEALTVDASDLSPSDAFAKAAAVATGLTSQYVNRTGASMLAAVAQEFPSATKRVQQIRNLSGQVVSNGVAMMGIYSQMPYAAAQRMCEIIVQLDTLKVKNLNCLRKHVVQVVNSVLTLANNTEGYVDNTIRDISEASIFMDQVLLDLAASQTISGGVTRFDSQAFERARTGMVSVSLLLAPDIGDDSILDLEHLERYGSVEAGRINEENARLVGLVIPSLINFLEVEASAYYSQVQVINHQVQSLTAVIEQFEQSASASRVAVERARSINDMRSRISELQASIDLAVERRSTKAAGGQMLDWTSQVKAIVAMMDRVKQLEFQEQPQDEATEEAFQDLLTDLLLLNNDVTVNGIEDAIPLRDAALALSLMSRRIMDDLEKGKATENRLATLHAQALTLATAQVNRIDSAIAMAQRQKTICQRYADLDIEVRPQYDNLVDSMRELGLDRAVDLLGSGAFKDFLDSDLDELSYMGAAINALTDALEGIDDIRTREIVVDIRDDMLARRTNMDVAAADQVDQGRTRLLDSLKSNISTIQRNAKTIASIAGELENALVAAGESVSVSVDSFTSFLGNMDHLEVGSGGRLAATLEEESDHPNAGVVSDDCL